MPANPDPTRISAAHWWLVEQLLALEPGTQWSGSYVRKSGYHGTGDDNERSWPGDYSIRDAEDRRGPSWRTRTAAVDWTFLDAQRGDYRRIATYGTRLRTAFDARDARLAGWREALGQTDTDAPPEGLDFRRWFTRVPDDTHRWHWHFSENREQVDSFANKVALLSVLSGESLSDWQRGGTVTDLDYGTFGRPASFVGNRPAAVQLADLWGQELFEASPYDGRTPSRRTVVLRQTAADAAAARQSLVGLASRLDALVTVVETLAETLRAGGTDLDTAAVLARVDERAREDVVRDEAHAAQLTALRADNEALRSRLAAAFGEPS